ncbi:hypothetical protein [Pelagibius marinus]|uniref:hypothetical protein n=1 Tax=Pelagibius marinus TaxID=2762760 RepID=UPI00187232E2|nr:hypothetical protein [Pelagibius marinus]
MRKILCFFVLVLAVGGLARPAAAGPVGAALGEMGASPQVQNAGDALQSELTTWATKGGATRGASGALGELALNSGNLICSAWIIGFRTKIRDMIIQNTGMSGDEQIRHQQLIQQAQRFAAQLELECTRVGLLGNTPGGGASGGGTPAGGDEMLPEPENAGSTLNRRPGETVADAICRHRCQPYLNRLQDEQRWLAEIEQSKQRAERRVQEKRARAEEWRRKARDWQAELDGLEKITSVAYNGNWPQSRKDEWVNAQTRSRSLERAVSDATDRFGRAAAEETTARAHLQSVNSVLAHQRQRVQQAQEAYNACLRRCLQQAADAKDPTTITCPEPPAHKSVSVGPNDKVGSSAQLGQDIKKSLGGGGGLGGLLGGGGGSTFGSKKPKTVPNRAGGGKQPKTQDDPIDDGDKVAQEIGDTELETGAMLVSDGLLVSTRIEDSPGDGTFQAVFLEDGQGRRMTPDRYEIYDLWREWTLTVWWTYDRWVDGQHVEHKEGGWSESGRETAQIAALQPGSAQEEGVWNRLGFSSAAKGVQGLGAHFALKPEDLSEPVDLVIHTTLPEEDPVTTQPIVYRLSRGEGSEVKLEPVTETLAVANDCY